MELSTVAKPYARAIFDIAQQDNTFANWQAVLSAGAELSNDKTLQAFIESPNTDKATKANSVNSLFEAILGRSLNQQESTLVILLLSNGRINVLPSILELFETMVNASGESKVFHVISAYSLSAAEEAQIISDLSKKYQTTVSIETAVDQDLVGGLVVKEGDKVIDLSIQARLDALNLRLSTTH